MIESHFVGLNAVLVVLLDDVEVLKEDKSAIVVLIWGEDHCEFGLPLQVLIMGRFVVHS